MVQLQFVLLDLSFGSVDDFHFFFNSLPNLPHPGILLVFLKSADACTSTQVENIEDENNVYIREFCLKMDEVSDTFGIAKNFISHLKSPCQ